MSQKPPENYPITGLCIVAEPNNCPPGYEAILHSHDKKDDCDMWKDSFLRSRVTRYLCYTRVFPLDNGHLNNVLADVAINMQGDMPPPGFSILDKTLDTSEKATKKKQICVKMLPRDACEDAITQLIILSKSKRPPIGFTLVGEMNSLVICYKIGPVPPETRNQKIDSNNAPITLQQNHFVGSSATSTTPLERSAAPAPPTLPSAQPQKPALVKEDSILQPHNSMVGVPFDLSCRLKDVHHLTTNAPEIQYRSRVDIDNEYTYSFHLERQATRGESPYSRDDTWPPMT